MSIRQADDPIDLFLEWYNEARRTGLEHPNAMTLATCDTSGMPSARMVLLKHADEAGFVFYTNMKSLKALQLDDNPQAALCFHWPPLKRQVRVRGQATRVSNEEADEYFATRPRDSQIGAWASKQSQPYTQWLELEKRVALYAARFGVGTIPRPDFWSGYRVVPSAIEFWQEGAFRLHHRLEYLRDGEKWASRYLFP